MMLVLMAVAIAALDLVTSSEVHSFLFGRLDQQISASQDEIVAYIDHVYDAEVRRGDNSAQTNPTAWLDGLEAKPQVSHPHLPALPPTLSGALSATDLQNHIPPEEFVEVIDEHGNLLLEHAIGPIDAPAPAPALPANLKAVTAPAESRPDRELGTYPPDAPAFDVGAAGAPSTRYRVEAASVPGGVLVVATPSGPTLATLSSLAHIEILVSVAVMLVLAVLVLWTVRIGLRPLEDMTETAGAFAKGDLSRRVRFSDERTEVGRLGRALNGMLVQIESAFGKREESEARLRRFVADASHDLRTPLTSIRGYAELLRKGAFSNEEERRRALGRIEHEADRMSVLVDDLLLLARLDQGRPLAREPVELRPLVADAVAAASAVDPGRPITLVASHGLLVKGDAGRLRQAVDNLLRNAIVHTPLGSPVEVMVQVSASAVRLSVSDHGPGLDPEEVEHVFDRFFQADPSRSGQGTGLGLSIVAAIADAHGGRTWVESVKGTGSTFFFELPLDDHDEETFQPPDVIRERDPQASEGDERVGHRVGG
jgi:two-component system, OmpR family, sensor kinase